MENFFDNRRLFNSIWNWKFHIVIASTLAVIGGVIFSSSKFIEPKFKSTAKVYPVNLAEYSEESESEQMLEFIRTNDIKFRMIEAFNLYDVYNINPEDPLHTTYILDIFNKNVSFKKTEFETIEIEVLDKDPVRAATMVDSAIVFYNDKVRNIHSAKYWESYHTLNNSIIKQEQEIQGLQVKMQKLRDENGLLEFESQVAAASEGLMEAAARGGNPTYAKSMLNNLKEKGGELKDLESVYLLKEKVLQNMYSQREQAYMHATKDITYSIVAEAPFPSDKKSYPVRWLIVFFSLVITFFVSVITVVVLDYIRDTKAAQ